MDRKNFVSFLFGRQVDEEGLVQTALAEEFRGQVAHVVGRGDEEDGRLLLLEPCEKHAQHTRGGAAVAVAVAGCAGEGLLDFVDPEHDGRDALGNLDGAPHVLLRTADVLLKNAAHVQSQQREMPR